MNKKKNKLILCHANEIDFCVNPYEHNAQFIPFREKKSISASFIENNRWYNIMNINNLNAVPSLK